MQKGFKYVALNIIYDLLEINYTLDTTKILESSEGSHTQIILHLKLLSIKWFYRN